MKGEDAKKAFLGGSAVRNDPASLEAGADLGPEIDEARCVSELMIRYAMNLLRCPSDRTGGAEMGIQSDDG